MEAWHPLIVAGRSLASPAETGASASASSVGWRRLARRAPNSAHEPARPRSRGGWLDVDGNCASSRRMYIRDKTRAHCGVCTRVTELRFQGRVGLSAIGVITGMHIRGRMSGEMQRSGDKHGSDRLDARLPPRPREQDRGSRRQNNLASLSCSPCAHFTNSDNFRATLRSLSLDTQPSCPFPPVVSLSDIAYQVEDTGSLPGFWGGFQQVVDTPW